MQLLGIVYPSYRLAVTATAFFHRRRRRRRRRRIHLRDARHVPKGLVEPRRIAQHLPRSDAAVRIRYGCVCVCVCVCARIIRIDGRAMSGFGLFRPLYVCVSRVDRGRVGT